jgi:hypothetical protein
MRRRLYVFYEVAGKEIEMNYRAYFELMEDGLQNR